MIKWLRTWLRTWVRTWLSTWLRTWLRTCFTHKKMIFYAIIISFIGSMALEWPTNGPQMAPA